MLVDIIRAEFCGEKVGDGIRENTNEENLKLLHNIAKRHDISHIVADVLFKQKLAPEEGISEIYKGELLMAVFRHQKFCYELERIRDLFEKNGIFHIPMKGAVIREYYPEPWLRTSCDIDVLVKKDQLETAASLLTEHLNYKLSSKGSHDWGFFTQDGFHIEIHFELVEEEPSHSNQPRKWNVSCLNNVWDFSAAAENKTYEYKMNDDFFFFYHMAHMAKHFENGGCGIRSIIDVWIMEHSGVFDKEKCDDLLESNGLIRFAECTRSLGEAWFGNVEYNELLLKFQKYIFDGGVYGNAQNRIAVQQHKKGSRTRYAISKIILPYNEIKYHYEILQKHKFLTPFMQVARWFKLIFFGGLKRSVNELSINNSIDESEHESVGRLLKDIGLQ